tara:strand:- start:501 stop:614 length:114 start_codon:yes stop_codon:yes gene_type:complete
MAVRIVEMPNVKLIIRIEIALTKAALSAPFAVIFPVI